MKTMLILFLLCAALFSITVKDIKDPDLKAVPKNFAGIELIEVLDGVPEELHDRYMVHYTADGVNKTNEFRVKGSTYVAFYGSRIRVFEDGMTVFDLEVLSGLRTKQTLKSAFLNGKPFPVLFFKCLNTDDHDDKMLVRVAFMRDPWGGRVSVTIFMADNLDDWMLLRIH